MARKARESLQRVECLCDVRRAIQEPYCYVRRFSLSFIPVGFSVRLCTNDAHIWTLCSMQHTVYICILMLFCEVKHPRLLSSVYLYMSTTIDLKWFSAWIIGNPRECMLMCSTDPFVASRSELGLCAYAERTYDIPSVLCSIAFAVRAIRSWSALQSDVFAFSVRRIEPSEKISRAYFSLWK